MQADPRTSFQVLPIDVNGDGWIDVLVANDGMENRLWLNQQGQGFVDRGAEFGLAVNLAGVAEASMGVDISDVDGDGQLDLLMTHLRGESNTLYQQVRASTFLDGSAALGLAGSDLPYTGWGVRWVDYNLDSWPDLFVVNGAESIGNQARPEDLNQAMAQPNLAYRNAAGRLVPVSEQMPPSWRQPGNSRGLASGDLNNDGAADLLVMHAGQRAQVFINQAVPAHWVGLEMRQATGPWPAQLVRVRLAGNPGADALSNPLGGFLSVSSARAVLPVGPSFADQPVGVAIDWGGEVSSEVSGLIAGQYNLVRHPNLPPITSDRP